MNKFVFNSTLNLGYGEKTLTKNIPSRSWSDLKSQFDFIPLIKEKGDQKLEY